jgi:hypothetical protein
LSSEIEKEIKIFDGRVFIMEKTEIERIAAEERKAYFKAWRAANKDKTAKHRRRYWEKRAIKRLNASNRNGGDDQ